MRIAISATTWRRHRLQRRNTAATAILETWNTGVGFCYRNATVTALYALLMVTETQLCMLHLSTAPPCDWPGAGTSQGQAGAANCRARVACQEKQCSGTWGH
jgi:hypothetical protein